MRTKALSKMMSSNEIVTLINALGLDPNLTNVYDPEIPVNIYDLGLIYDINISKGNNVFIKMSLTSPGCPVAGELPKQVADELTKIKNIGLIEVELVWDPPWTKERMSEDAKLALDI